MATTKGKSHFRPSAYRLPVAVLLASSLLQVANCLEMNFLDLAESSLSLLKTEAPKSLLSSSTPRPSPAITEASVTKATTTTNITLPEGESRLNGGALQDLSPPWMGSVFLPIGSPEIRGESGRFVGIAINLDKHNFIMPDDTARRLKNLNIQCDPHKIPSYAFPTPSVINIHDGASGRDKELWSLRGVRNALGGSDFGLYHRLTNKPTDIDFILTLHATPSPLETKIDATPNDCWMFGYSPHERVDKSKRYGKRSHKAGDLFLTKQKVIIKASDCHGPVCLVTVPGGSICPTPADHGAPIVCEGKVTYLVMMNKFGGCTSNQGKAFKVAYFQEDIHFYKDNNSV